METLEGTADVVFASSKSKDIEMQAHQLRVVEEKKQLDERIESLYDGIVVFQGFFETLPKDEQERLKRQLEIMKQYSEILEERIKHFN